VATTAASAQLAPGVLQGIPVADTTPVIKVHHENSDDNTPAKILTSLPGESWTVTDWYKQTVYDRGNSKIGEVMDVLLDHDGKVDAIIVGVGGFLGMGEKDVAVAYQSIHFKKDSNSWRLMMNTTKDALKQAPGFKYDRTTKTWMAEKSPSSTTGGPAPTRMKK
jgi:sporulation protein YlmC with PRC-barrel domain